MVKTDKHELIGAYTSSSWRHLDRYFGNGECSVFRLRPRPRLFRWAAGNKEPMMMLGTMRALSIGSQVLGFRV